jgi:cytidine deaminase
VRCHICNSILTPAEVQFNNDHQEWDPCGRCLEAIDEVFSHRTEEEIDEELQFELFEEDQAPGTESN